VAELDQARVLYDRLHNRHPEQREFHWGTALSRTSMGAAFIASNSLDRAKATLREAARLYDRLVVDYAGFLPIAQERNMTYDALTQLDLNDGSLAEAAGSVLRAIGARFEVIAAVSKSKLPVEQQRALIAKSLRELVAECRRWASDLARRVFKTGSPGGETPLQSNP
jgi:hypothetical protein